MMRPGYFIAILLVARQAIGLTVKTRKTLFLGVLAVVYCGMVALVLSRVHERARAADVFTGMVVAGVFTGLIPFTTMFLSVSALSRELEERTFTYLFVRPIHRSAILLGKYLAAALVATTYSLVLVSVAFLLFTESPWRWAPGRELAPGLWPTLALCAVVAPCAYAAVGMLCAASFRRPFLVSMLFVIGWEAMAGAALPQAGIRSLTVSESVRVMMLGPGNQDRRLRAEIGHLLGRHPRDRSVDQERLRALEERQAENATSSLVGIVLVSLGIAAFLFSRREYESRPKE
jgi:ABC-type transport system involved in multi-copper enzyme maturation permease subunit